MREFSAEYLRTTRRGMWADSREALEVLDLPDRARVLDVGCGTGELTAVLAEETGGTVYGLDADRTLLRHASEVAEVVAGDATVLPVADDAVDLVVCQALLVNLPDPERAVSEFARASADAVAAIEPDNASVTVRSTVDDEAALAERARAAYREGVDTDVSLGGPGTRECFEDAGLEDVRSVRYDHVRRIEPPYGEHAVTDVRRKASGDGLASDRATMLAGGLSVEAYEDLRERWRAMGREAVDQVREGTYRREEVVPFHVTVGDAPE